MPDEVQERRELTPSFEGQLTQEDVRRGYALHFQPSWMGGRGTRLAAPVAAVLIGIAGLVWPFSGAMPAAPGLSLLFALLLLVAVLVATVPWWAPAVHARNTWRAGGGVADLRSGTADEEGLHTVTAHVDSRQSWQAFVMIARADPDTRLTGAVDRRLAGARGCYRWALSKGE